MVRRRRPAPQPRRQTTITRTALPLLLLTLLLGAVLPTPARAAGSRYFSETGHTCPEIFANYWAAHGGVATFGLPISEPYSREGLTIQWFERARFERHVENKDTSFEVQLGQLGREIRPADPPVAPDGAKGSRYFIQTGHNLALFLPYWNTNGGLERFGLPLTEEVRETNVADGKPYTVQYFERARLEYHPETRGNADEVQLGLIGMERFNTVKVADPVAASAGKSVPPPVAAAAPASGAATAESIELLMWRTINIYRASRGVPPLAYDPLVAKAAANHVDDMIANNFLEHIGSDGRRPIDRMRAVGVEVQWASENISMECAKDPATAVKNVQAWMLSEPYADGVYNHHWNLLYKGYSRIGISFRVGKNGCWVVAENFADGTPSVGSQR